MQNVKMKDGFCEGAMDYGYGAGAYDIGYGCPCLVECANNYSPDGVFDHLKILMTHVNMEMLW